MEIKLSEWCKNNNIKYGTAYSWVSEERFPGKIRKTDNGTIFVEIADLDLKENNMPEENNNPEMSQVLKKSLEFSIENKSISDFAVYILSNYKLESLTKPITKEKPKPLKLPIKPTTAPTAAQEHFKQFLGTKHDQDIFQNDDQALQIPEPMLNIVNNKVQKPINKISNVTMRPIDEDILIKSNLTINKGIVTIRPISDESSIEMTVGKKDCVGDEPRNLKDIKKKQDKEKNDPLFKAASAQEKEDQEIEDMVPYLPVKYDEARAFVDILVKNGKVNPDPFSMDKKAKSFCNITREEFEVLKGKSK